MQIHEMNLHDAPFASIASGQKVIELRLWDEKRRMIKVGDQICFRKKSDESITAIVYALHLFSDFSALYEALIPLVGAIGLGYAPGETPDPADMLDYYTEERIAQYGVVGIEIKLTEDSCP